MKDLMYQKDSFAAPFNEQEVVEFQRWLNRCGYERIVFYGPYLEHLRMFHGGRPGRKYFETKENTRHVITRFLNFASNDHLLAEYSVEATWSAVSDRIGKILMPFAELFAGDLLCFDYSKSTTPRIVVWFHERSRPDEAPEVEEVASTFETFLELLSDKPNSTR